MTHIYSRKAYQNDKKFAKIVEETSREANNLEHHMELIQEYYPKLVVIQLWTYEHGGMSIDKFKRCQFDSSADAFAATDNPNALNRKLSKINKELL